MDRPPFAGRHQHRGIYRHAELVAVALELELVVLVLHVPEPKGRAGRERPRQPLAVPCPLAQQRHQPFLRPRHQAVGAVEVGADAAEDDRRVPRDIDELQGGEQKSVRLAAASRPAIEGFFDVEVRELQERVLRRMRAVRHPSRPPDLRASRPPGVRGGGRCCHRRWCSRRASGRGFGRPRPRGRRSPRRTRPPMAGRLVPSARRACCRGTRRACGP